MSGETQVESVDVEVKGAEEGAAKVDKLTAAVLKLNAAKSKQANASPMVDALAGSSGFAKVSNAVGKIFGQGASDKLTAAGASLAEAGDKLGLSPDMLKAAGGVVASGGAAVAAGAVAVAAAAAALTVAAGAVLYAGIKFGVEQTDAANTQKAIFSKIGKGGGYKVAVKVAADLGLDEGAVETKMKALLNAKFSEGQAAKVIKVGVALDAVQGEGSGDKFAKTLENIRNGGKFDSKAIKQFAKEGISADEVYQRLAKSLGISVDQAKAKVKAGTLDVDKGIEGVIDVATGKFGGVADKIGNSIPGLIQKIKTKFGDLFKGFDISPIQGFLKNVAGVLGSPAGQAFGKAFGKLGSEVIHLLFGPLDGGGGKSKMTAIVVAITSGVNKVTAGLKAAEPTVRAAIAWIGDLISPKKGSDGPGAKVREMAADFLKLYQAVKPVAGPILAVLKIAVPAAFTAFIGVTKAWGAALSALLKPISSGIGAIQHLVDMVSGAAPKASKGGKAVGKAIPDGILAGILGGQGGALAAAGGLAASLLARVKAVLGVASPSKAFQFVGAMNAAGMAKGMNDNASAPAGAAAKMAAGAAGAAAGKGGGKAAGGGAAAGGGGPTIQILNNFAAGTTPAQAKAVAGANAEEWKRQMRAWQREQQEGKAA